MTLSGGLPHLAGASELERWADTRSAQADLPIVVRRLVRAENDQVQRVEMRGGDGVGLTGYDGFVETTRSTPFVPDGFSVWEMGVGGDPEKKAQRDYRTRTDKPNGVDRATTTFVFVTPRRWEKKKDWEQRRRDERIWRDVRVLDADDIEQALEVSPAVQIWLSELLGMDPFGATSIEDWWDRFSRGFRPSLTSSVVLAGREDQAAALTRRLADEVGRTFIRAASIDDGLAFAACSMMMMGANDSEPMLAKSLLVHDGVTLRRLERTSSLLILLPYEEHLQRDAHLIDNHHVVFVTTDSDGDADVDLPPLDHLALRSALKAAGVPEVDLDRYMRAGNKSLVALRRVSTQSRDPEAWRANLIDRPIRRAWLAGAWSQTRSGDAEVMDALTAIGGEELEERLAAAIRQPDPLFTKVGSTWAVAAPEDSWRVARQVISDRDLTALEHAIQTVLGAVDPRLELPAKDRWLADIHGKSRIHSSDLRKGLGRSLALMGARGDDLWLTAGRSARQWAERVAWNLFERATQDRSAQLWTSMEDVVPLLAEAAPDAFLRALSQSASGTEPLARKLFQDVDADWNAGSPHTGFLWALEGLAWSEQHMGYAAEVLAQLAELDPGGRLSNRPSASLEAIFKPWHPQTSAPLQTRIQTLDALIRRHVEVAWRLLLELIPEPSGFASQAHHPQFRDWGGPSEPSVTRVEFNEMVTAAADRVLKLASEKPDRWVSVLPKLGRMPAESRHQALDALGRLDPANLNSHDRLALWEAIDRLVRRHRDHEDAEWSMNEETLTALSDVRGRVRPNRPSDVHRWLFDEWHPSIGVAPTDDLEGYDTALDTARQIAIREVFEGEGWDATVALARTVELPWAVGSSISRVSSRNDEAALALLDSSDRSQVQFAEGYARARLAGDHDGIREWVARFPGRPLLQARLLQLSPDVEAAWRLLDEYGAEVDSAYWSEFVPYGRGPDFPLVNDVARQLVGHGRAAMALHALSMYAARQSGVETDVVIEALEAFGTREDPEAARVSDYNITRLLEYLKEQGIDEETIALLEWRYLPLLHDESRTLALESLLARSPKTFVDVVELVFRRANEDEDAEPRNDNPALASNAYRLLREWKVVPGTREDGTVDGDALNEWLAEASRLLSDVDRRDIGELQIGEVLAHAPEDPDGTFPTLPVRNALEAAGSNRLERGFSVGLFNKRGITSRGLTEGGKQEYDLATKYEWWANAVQAAHPRTASVLRDMAESYREEGRRNDEEVRRYLEGLDR
ncbi:hypothetical protein ASG49_00415 [Marmoricola sp. Leaf446]|uniref:hypothetical protein n=1 Tax=Marmoricola sp. Leaf446 TaxID=1736379 RepID=UPI0006F91EA6|nr:hypothetical protein [Marmoricola sp. Leaf446]KQT93519.1 hypothetical protein ASG49_00415 [Marmoricola sp. Leaf446]